MSKHRDGQDTAFSVCVCSQKTGGTHKVDVMRTKTMPTQNQPSTKTQLRPNLIKAGTDLPLSHTKKCTQIHTGKTNTIKHTIAYL